MENYYKKVIRYLHVQNTLCVVLEGGINKKFKKFELGVQIVRNFKEKNCVN